MPSERAMPEMVATISMPGAAEWLSLSDELVSGLVHALNNRVTAVSVCAELASLGDEQMLRDGVLGAELTRLQRVGALIGLLPARGHAPEALEIAPVVDDAIAIHAYHPRTRAIECVMERQGIVQPLRAPRWALLRLVLYVIDAAKSEAQTAGRTMAKVRLSGDEQWVWLRARARDSESCYATEMATLCGGALAREGEELLITLPSLPEIRQRERASRLSD
jgi:hypothetical protein